MSLQIDLKDKTAMITGVTSGIGAGVAKMFARSGANVVGCGTSHPDSDEAKNFIKSIAEQDQPSLYCK
ncbi:MAG TPA: SDR family NAD(P)-dependent oxidoreductase, partial [Candidatus Babeliaceae bacterium]|nr:SDR family NAD(P)-dependent oxidoreductase [Candidatus Babeliaceae bacterium]